MPRRSIKKFDWLISGSCKAFLLAQWSRTCLVFSWFRCSLVQCNQIANFVTSCNPPSKRWWVLSQSNSSSISFYDNIGLVMDVVNSNAWKLPVRFVHNKCPALRLLGQLRVLVFQGQHVSEMDGNTSCIAYVIVCKEVWYQLFQCLAVLVEVSLSEWSYNVLAGWSPVSLTVPYFYTQFSLYWNKNLDIEYIKIDSSFVFVAELWAKIMIFQFWWPYWPPFLYTVFTTEIKTFTLNVSKPTPHLSL